MTRNIFEAWFALTEDQRMDFLRDLDGGSLTARRTETKRVVAAILRAAAEPEANPNVCKESSLLAWGAHLIDEEKKGGAR